MASRKKTILLRLMVSLQFWPFTAIFSAIYRLAVWISVLSVSRFPGVLAVYLSGSLARSSAIYGLSDIDFTIFIQGNKSEDVIRKIRHLFLRLKRWFPMLGSAEEKGVYFLLDFIEDYKRYPMLQHLFDKNFYGHRLLWGKDVLAQLDLPYLSCRDVLLTYVWKLRYWMEKVLFFLERDNLTEIQQYHTFYKAISNISDIYLKMILPKKRIEDREEALLMLKNVLDDDDMETIDQLLANHHCFYRRRDISLDTLFLLFKKHIGRCLKAIDEAYKISPPSEHWIGINRPLLRNIDTEVLRDEKWVRTIKSICGGNIKVEVFNTLSVPVSTLDCTYFGRSTYLVCCSKPLNLLQVTRLQAFYRREMLDSAILLVKESSMFVYAVHSDMLEHWMYTPIEEQHMFLAWFSSRETALASETVSRLIKRLHPQISEIRTFAAGRKIRRLDSKIYLNFFFSALQRLIFYRSLVSGKFLYLETAEEICSYLLKNTPLTKNFLERLLNVFINEKKGKSDLPYINMEKTSAFLRLFSDIVNNNDSFKRLASLNSIDDRVNLKISVVVITRNRAQQLKACLYSIYDQRRPPDEVIVVDNGSTDSTKDVVSAFNASRSVSYVFEPIPGVSQARNAGVTAASGDIVAFLDDDAVAAYDWLFFIEQSFSKDPRIGIVGGAIHHMVEDRTDVVYRYHEMQEEN